MILHTLANIALEKKNHTNKKRGSPMVKKGAATTKKETHTHTHKHIMINLIHDNELNRTIFPFSL